MSEQSIQFIDPCEILKYWNMIYGSNAVKLYGSRKIMHDIGKVMTAEYSAVKGIIDDEVKFIFIWRTEWQFKNNKPVKTAVSEQIIAPRYLLVFKDRVIDLLRSLGYAKMTGITARNPDAMARLLGVEKHITVSLGKEI